MSDLPTPHPPARSGNADPDRWTRVQELFHAVADLPDAAREDAVVHGAAGDESLAREVRDLIALDRGGDSALDRGLAAMADPLLGGESLAGVPEGAFGPYQLLRPLGEGGMGVVYLAARRDLGGQVAIKVLRDAWLSPARRERFALEQRTLSQLHHPGIAQLHDAGTLPDGTPWFVMEYVEGSTLTEWAATRRAPLTERLRMFRAVCEAVQHAHDHAVIHRDLKPSNILVTPDGHVKLLDFGIAKQLDDLETSADQTRTGVRPMTPAYAAPEQIQGGRIGTRTDVYALGVTLYELLAGRLPFPTGSTSGAAGAPESADAERPSVVARREAARANDPDRLVTSDRAAWADLDVLTLTAMHRDPGRRYPSVGALIRDLDHFVRGEPLEARPDTVGYRAAKFVRRNRGPVTVALLALALVVGMSAVYTVRLTEARDRAQAEATRAQRIQRFMTDLFEGGDATAGPADSLRVIELVDRGIREAGSLMADPLAQADLYASLGTIAQQLGRLPLADSLLSLALARRRAHHDTGHPDIVAALVAMAGLRLDQARVDSAEALAREAVALAEAHLAPRHPLVAGATLALGRALVERSAFEEAVPVLEQAVARYRAAGPPGSDLVAAMSELANRHFYAGNYEASDSLNREILAIDRRLHGDHHPRVADDLINLGAIRFQRGQYAEAEAYYREGLAIIEQWYGGDHFRTGSALTMLGRAQLFLNQEDSSAATLTRSLQIQERVFGPTHPRVASILNELGSIALRQRRFEDAETYYRRMGGIYRVTYGDHHWLSALANANLGGAAYERGNHREAERLFRSALDTFTETQGPTHQNSAIVRIRLGRTLLQLGRLAEAVAECEAGYELLAPQVRHDAIWLQRARLALAEGHARLGHDSAAARWREEIADSGRAAAARRAAGQ